MGIDKYEKLLEQLLKNKEWPLVYMFKFIVPNRDGLVEKVVSILPTNGKMSFNHTKSLKYVAITCIAEMESAELIVSTTSEATDIKGVMAL